MPQYAALDKSSGKTLNCALPEVNASPAICFASRSAISGSSGGFGVGVDDDLARQVWHHEALVAGLLLDVHPGLLLCSQSQKRNARLQHVGGIRNSSNVLYGV